MFKLESSENGDFNALLNHEACLLKLLNKCIQIFKEKLYNY